MRKKVTAAIVAAVFLCLAAFAVVYTRPLKIEQRYPEIDLSQCTRISGYYRIDGNSDEFTQFVFYPEDARFNEMVELFRSPAFKTRLNNLFPQGTKVHANHEGDFQWTVSFRFESVLSGKSVISGEVLRADDFYGDLELSFDGKQVKCSVTNQDQWLESVMSAIVQ